MTVRGIGKRLTIGLVILVVLALIAAVAVSLYVVRRPLPGYAGEHTVQGIADEVTIVRNAQGVPDIYAHTDADLFFAQGFVHAQDRFFEMDYRRHVTSGRLAELVGDVPEAIAADAVIRTFGWRAIAEEEFADVSDETRAFLEAYTAGVNQYIGSREASELGLEYTVLGIMVEPASIEPWSPVDSLAWLKAMAWDMRGNFDEELERAQILRATSDTDRVAELFPEYPYSTNAAIIPGADWMSETGSQVLDDTQDSASDSPGASGERTLSDDAADALGSAGVALAAVPSLLGEGDGIGSNSFVVSGEHTDTGAPILANDPHLVGGAPGIWHQVGLHCVTLNENCTFDVSGFSFSGMPGIVIGHNADLAWGLTNLGADVTDLFLERVNSDGTYIHGDDRPRIESRTEVITVAGSDPVTIEVRSTLHGPIVSDALESAAEASARPKPAASPPPGVDGYAVSLAWTALRPTTTIEAVFAMNRASDAGDVAAAAALFEVPSMNIVFATTAGDIGYQAPGTVPIRNHGLHPELNGIDEAWPRLGWDPDYDWQGYVLPENLPSALNPEEGFIVAANQAVTEIGGGPYLTNDWDYGFRSQRLRTLIEESIAAGEPITVERANEFMMDASNPLAERLVPMILGLDVTENYLTTALDELRTWRDEGYVEHVDSSGAAYFNTLWAHLLELTFGDELPEEIDPSGGSRWVQVVLELLDDPENEWWDDQTTVNVTETRDEVLLQSLIEARNELTNRLGSDATTWRWGDLHKARFEHPILSPAVAPGILAWLMNPTPVEVAGSGTSPLATSWNAAAREGGRVDFTMTSSPSMRMVVDMSALDSSTWVVTTGVSGHPASPHYADQAGSWASGDYYPWPATREAVEAAGANTLVLTPED